MSGRVIAFGAGARSRIAIADELRDLADRVERGELSNVAVAVVIENRGGIGTFYGMVEGAEQRWPLIGALEELKHRLREG